MLDLSLLILKALNKLLVLEQFDISFVNFVLS